jgi:hypothetical protein
MAAALSVRGLATALVVLRGALIRTGIGTFDLRPFNLDALSGAAGGVVSSALASIALWRGWGRK